MANPKKQAMLINPVYIPYLKLDTRYQLFFGGSSSGKSFFLAQRIVLDVMTGSRNYLICRQVQSTIKRSVFNEICKVIYSLNAEKYFKINKSDMIITYNINKKQIIFVGLEDPERLKSVTPINGVITDIFIEEATEVEYIAFKQLDKRLRGQSTVSKRITMTFNPILQSHWIYKEFFADLNWTNDNKIHKDKKRFILKTTYKDNIFLEEDDVKALENETDMYYYQVYTLGNFGILGAVIFKNYEIRDLSEEINTFDRIESGLDWGFSSDPATYIRCYFDRKKQELYILDEIYGAGWTNQEFAEKIKAKYTGEIITADSSEKKSVEELRQEGLNIRAAKKGPGSVETGYKYLQSLKVIINSKCTNTIKEFMSHKWKEDRHGTVLPVPEDKNNHAIDAIRYMLEDKIITSTGIHFI